MKQVYDCVNCYSFSRKKSEKMLLHKILFLKSRSQTVFIKRTNVETLRSVQLELFCLPVGVGGGGGGLEAQYLSL